MSAAAALRVALQHGIRIEVAGEGLLLEAGHKPPAEVLDHLAQHKAELLSLLRPGPEWTVEEWRTFFDERAGIREFDGGLHRQEAEVAAYADTLAEWLRQHPSASARHQREVEATAVLEAMGIRDPVKSPDDFGKTGAG